MSCRSTIRDVIKGCTDWAKATSDECEQRREVTTRECVERAEEDIERCDEEREERTKQCDDWEWVDCPIPIVCGIVEALVGWVCNAWVWVTHKVCVVTTVIPAGTCLLWETIKNTACQVAMIVVRESCRFAGAIVELLVCPIVDLVSQRILWSDDEPKAASVPRLSADSMSIARVESEHSYRDSGTRYFFRINGGGVAEVSTLTEGWRPIARPRRGPESIDYRRTRTPLPVRAPRFDMIVADSGRVFVKEESYARFYVAMLDPMFRGAGNEPFPSCYFKLDPEQGEPDADNADRLVHLAGVPDTHPATIRFPLFRHALQIDLNDTMVVNLDHNPEVWHRVDARPPKDGGDPPDDSGFPKPEPVVGYGSTLTRILRLAALGHVTKLGYRVKKVLDIGIGHQHWHEHRLSIYGGEMDSLDGPGLPPCLEGRNAYRLFNGPVDDQGGFIDGTVNYYVLGQFVKGHWTDADTVPPDAFGVLWLDEQAVLSERWRLLDPADFDFGGFKKIVPSAIVQYLEADFDFKTIRFHRGLYWDPLRAGHITSASRMAVSRQVVVLSGRDPKTNDWELYSINGSFGTSDRTWRWRRLPLAPIDGRIPRPADFGLREDMTLFVREPRKDADRVWFQRYRSATLNPPPAGEDLRLPVDADTNSPPRRNLELPKPARPIEFEWQWLPSDVFEFCHRRLTHFGCYEPTVDGRSQYYRVSILEGEEYVRPLPESTRYEDVQARLSITQDFINWDYVNRVLKGEEPAAASDLLQKLLVLASSMPGAISGAFSAAVHKTFFGALADLSDVEALQQVLCEIYNEIREDPDLVRQVQRRSLFYPKFQLALRFREPLGFLMTHWDKRDDDLLPFDLPKDGTPVDLTLRPHGLAGAVPSIVVRIRGHKPVPDIPRVIAADVTVYRATAGAPSTLCVGLQPGPGVDVDENIWRIKIGFVRRDASGAPAAFQTVFDRFRLSADDASSDSDGRHAYTWNLSSADAERLSSCCDAKQWRRHGTSVWFEDVVGHVGTADCVAFAVQ